jgi:hypothetical protein
MDKKFGKCRKDGWANVQIIYENEKDEIEDMTEM